MEREMAFEERQNILIDAILEGSTDNTVVRRLIQDMKDPDLLKWATKDRDISPVGACIKSGSMEMLNLLLEHGAPPNVYFGWHPDFTKPSDTPVMLAIKMKRPEMLSRLLQVGSHSEEFHYVSCAMFLSDRELGCFKVLMKHYIDHGQTEDAYLFPVEDNNYFCPFMAALDNQSCMFPCWEEDDEDVEPLEKDVNHVSDIIDVIIQFGFPLDTYVMSWIGLPEDPEPEAAYCPLEMAIMNQHIKAAVLLIKAGCSVRGKDDENDILMYSILYRTFELIHILIYAGSEVAEKHISAIQKIHDGEDIYTYRYHDNSKEPRGNLVKWVKAEWCNPASLKRRCRVVIRNCIREATDQRTILPSIECLTLPVHTKEYLALDIL